MDNTGEPDILNSAEAAQYLRVSPHTLSIWRSKKRYDLPYLKVGRFIRYRKEDLCRFIDNNLQAGK